MLRAHPPPPPGSSALMNPVLRAGKSEDMKPQQGQWLTKELGIWGMSRSLEATEVRLWDQWKREGGTGPHHSSEPQCRVAPGVKNPGQEREEQSPGLGRPPPGAW